MRTVPARGGSAHGAFRHGGRLAAAAALLIGRLCSGSSDSGDDKGRRPHDRRPRPSDATRPRLPASLTSQKLDWGRCKATAERPRTGRRLAVRDAQGAAGLREAGRRDDRPRADPRQGTGDADEAIGSLLFNFGGPGGSGVVHPAVVRGTHESHCTSATTW